MIEEKTIKIGDQYYKLEQKFVLSEQKNVDNNVEERKKKNYRGDIYRELQDCIYFARNQGKEFSREDEKKKLAELKVKKINDIISAMDIGIATFKDYYIDDTDLMVIAENLSSLKILDLSTNYYITEMGIKYLANGLKNSIEDNKEEFRKLKIGDDYFQTYFLMPFRFGDKNNKLQGLYLNNSNINDKSVEYLSEALKSGECQLIELALIGNHITDEGVKALAEALKSPNCKLHILDLFNNNITDEGLKILAEALKSPNCKLHRLSCLNNYTNYSNDVAKTLGEALIIGNCCLRELDEYKKYFSPEFIFLDILENPFKANKKENKNLFNKIISNLKFIINNK